MPTPSSSIAAPTTQLALFAAEIKIGHTVFALPFALLATFLAADGWPKVGQLLLIVLCMVCARTLAMAMNRLLDAHLDALNPRTAGRAIPAGTLSRGFFIAAAAVCSAGFIATTSGFWFCDRNPWPVTLSVPVLAFLGAYPLLKRFTRLCHYYLGAALALAPVCAWVAIRGDIAWPPLVMAAAVLLWTAGFDIIYACQDYQSDVQTGVVSVPAALGIARALWLARFTHLASAAMLLLLGRIVPQFGVLYFTGAGSAATLLVVEHLLVKPDDLSKVGLAFFTINGIISLILGTLGILDVFF